MDQQAVQALQAGHSEFVGHLRFFFKDFYFLTFCNIWNLNYFWFLNYVGLKFKISYVLINTIFNHPWRFRYVNLVAYILQGIAASGVIR